jgi:hypothetical protein
MYICWKCGHEYDDDDVEYCIECGAVNPATLPIDETAGVNRDDFVRALQARLKRAGHVEDPDFVIFEIGGEEIFVSLEKRIVFGREFQDLEDAQMINLEFFKGHEAGVSRRHAAIYRNDLDQIVLIDLGSTNGTTLNGEGLEPLQEYLLKDGDEIRLGSLGLMIRLDDL